ncbi:MAG: 50S ribosomal protein L19 [Candidatus Nealsonbacteria bacterium]|nr:50S ribosomal protein L19 [Candidatus Nealsonbacteria bacterium]
MTNKNEKFNPALRNDFVDIRPGDTVRIHHKINISGQDKTQIFEGLVLARKHGKGISSTITVRKMVSGIGVEKIFPLHSPIIEKIEKVKRGKVRRAKLYYLREATGIRARLKASELEKEEKNKKEKKEVEIKK